MKHRTCVLIHNCHSVCESADGACKQYIVHASPYSEWSLYGSTSPVSFVAWSRGGFPVRDAFLQTGTKVLAVLYGAVKLTDVLENSTSVSAPSVLLVQPGPDGVLLRREQSEDALVVELDVKGHLGDEPSLQLWDNRSDACIASAIQLQIIKLLEGDHTARSGNAETMESSGECLLVVDGSGVVKGSDLCETVRQNSQLLIASGESAWATVSAGEGGLVGIRIALDSRSWVHENNIDDQKARLKQVYFKGRCFTPLVMKQM